MLKKGKEERKTKRRQGTIKRQSHNKENPADPIKSRSFLATIIAASDFQQR
jgi:hypothetical protein